MVAATIRGDAEIAGLDIAGLDTNGRGGKGGHCRTGHNRSDNVQSCNVHPCIFVGPSLSSPAISVAPVDYTVGLSRRKIKLRSGCRTVYGMQS